MRGTNTAETNFRQPETTQKLFQGYTRPHMPKQPVNNSATITRLIKSYFRLFMDYHSK